MESPGVSLLAAERGTSRRPIGVGPISVALRFSYQQAMRDAGVESVELNSLLRKCDFVSIHCPLTTESPRLPGKAEFRMMQNNAFLKGTSRGGVLDEQALFIALGEGWIAGAGLDILELEPPSLDSPLLKLDNVVLTPHIAAFSDEFERKLWSASIEKLESLN
jgi:phosphoglycerate dehydrogenase-like enzyme